MSLNCLFDLNISPSNKVFTKTIIELTEQICNSENDDDNDDVSKSSSNEDAAANANASVEISIEDRQAIFMKSRQIREIKLLSTQFLTLNGNQMKHELKTFNEKGIRGPRATRICDSLKSIRSTSVGPEQSLPTSEKVMTKFRLSLGDDTKSSFLISTSRISLTIQMI